MATTDPASTRGKPTIFDFARRYVAAGVSVIPINHKTKRPLNDALPLGEDNKPTWKPYQDRLPLPEELSDWFASGRVKSLAAIGGQVSGNLCIIDFDVTGYYERWREAVGELAAGLPVQQTGGGGYQVFFRAPDPGRNDKLAWHPCETHESGREVAIETRAEGGYAVIPPSLHPTGNTYHWLPNTGNPGKIPMLAQARADALLNAARTLCQAPYTRQELEAQQRRVNEAQSRKRSKSTANVIEAYNQAHPIREILELHGYTPRGGGYCRPGVTDRQSVLIHDNKSFHFSTNDILNGPHLVDPFDVFAAYEHGGDAKAAFKAAAAELGIEKPPRKTKPYEEYCPPPNDIPPDMAEYQGDDYPPDDVSPEQKTPGHGSYRDVFSRAPFRPLGHNGGTYFYLPNGTRQVVKLSAKDHQKVPLLAIAPVQWWENTFGDGGKPDWLAAANALFRKNESIGIFNPLHQRGLGAWEDDGRIVLHRGDHLVVDGERYGITDFKTKYIYEMTYPLGDLTAPPLSAKEANRLIDIVSMLPFDDAMHGKLLAGWIVIAPICGVLSWRPHAWLTGGHGTGKTWIKDHIISPLLGEAGVSVQADSTGAGIAQFLRRDARPVVFDEAEGEDERNQSRIQNVLNLMRQSSSNGEGIILKGSPGQNPIYYEIQSCFLFASIGVNLVQKSDASRVTILDLIRQPQPSADAINPFHELRDIVARTIKKEWAEQFQARSIHLIRTIISNAQTFSDVAAERLGSRRAGDQYGALLAGLYSLYSNGEITRNDANLWVKKQNWSVYTSAESESDEEKCLRKILQFTVDVRENGNIKPRTIGKLISIWAKTANAFNDPNEEIGEVSILDAKKTLLRYGIKLVFVKIGDEINFEKSKLLISDNHESLKNIMKNSPWKNNFHQFLHRLPNATKTDPTKFDAPQKSRATSLPLSEFVEKKEDAEYE